MTNYVGVLDGSGKVWGVRLPHLLGCVGGGAIPEEAIADATSAFREVAAYRRGAGYELRAPSTGEQVLKSGEDEAGETIVLIPLLVDAGRTVRANLTLDAGLLEAIDAARDKLMRA